MAATDYNVLID